MDDEPVVEGAILNALEATWDKVGVTSDPWGDRVFLRGIGSRTGAQRGRTDRGGGSDQGHLSNRG